MDSLAKLEGVSYQLKSRKFGDVELKSDMGSQIGFIAQDVQKLFPELVQKDKEGFLAVNYTGLIPVLVEGVKEQRETISSLKDKLSRLEEKMDMLLNEK